MTVGPDLNPKKQNPPKAGHPWRQGSFEQAKRRKIINEAKRKVKQ